MNRNRILFFSKFRNCAQDGTSGRGNGGIPAKIVGVLYAVPCIPEGGGAAYEKNCTHTHQYMEGRYVLYFLQVVRTDNVGWTDRFLGVVLSDTFTTFFFYFLHLFRCCRYIALALALGAVQSDVTGVELRVFLSCVLHLDLEI